MQSDVKVQHSYHIQNVFQHIVQSLRICNQLPKLGHSFEIFSTIPLFHQLIEIEGSRILELISNIMRCSGVRICVDDLDIDEQLEKVIQANDAILERICIWLDDAGGVRQKEQAFTAAQVQPMLASIATSWNRKNNVLSNAFHKGEQRSSNSYNVIKLLAAKNVVRPQLQFHEFIDNSKTSFKCKLKLKHNAKKERTSNLTLFVDNEFISPDCNADIADSHPYRYELETWLPSAAQLKTVALNDCLPISADAFSFVNSTDQLYHLIEELKKQSEFAVDLEHHSYRSFLGLTCLLQISTRTHDYVIDPFPIWRDLYILNDPFSDPKIVKVFHGADSDILWLQRDFGVYVVNMFDTSQAMRVLQMSRFSLAHLLKEMLSLDVDKQFQLADWRIRPLPEQMLSYARADTHYLLYCYDRLRNLLIERSQDSLHPNLLQTVWTRSRDICLSHYEKPQVVEDAWLALAERARRALNSRQILALAQLWRWRDSVARREDESIYFVLPNHMLLQMAEVLPREPQGVLACCNPVPPLVRQELQQLFQIISRAREIPDDNKATIAYNDLQSDNALFSMTFKREPHPLLQCQHDCSHIGLDEEMISQSIFDLKSIKNSLSSSEYIKEQPLLHIFDARHALEVKNNFSCCRRSIEQSNFSMSPFEKYLHSIDQEVKKQKSKVEKMKVKSKKQKLSKKNLKETVALNSMQQSLLLSDDKATSTEAHEGTVNGSTNQNGNLSVKRKRKRKDRLLPTISFTTLSNAEISKKMRMSSVVPFDYSVQGKQSFNQAKAETLAIHSNRKCFEPNLDDMPPTKKNKSCFINRIKGKRSLNISQK